METVSEPFLLLPELQPQAWVAGGVREKNVVLACWDVCMTVIVCRETTWYVTCNAPTRAL